MRQAPGPSVRHQGAHPMWKKQVGPIARGLDRGNGRRLDRFARSVRPNLSRRQGRRIICHHPEGCQSCESLVVHLQ